LYAPDTRDGAQNVQGVMLPRLAHSSTASFSTRSRIWRFSSCSGTTSTGRRSNWASWSV